MSFLRFLASGGLSTLLDVLFFWLLKQLLPVDVAYAVSYSLCVVIRYFIDARLTFATERMHLRQFLAYFVANLLVMYLGMKSFDLIRAQHYADMIARILAIPEPDVIAKLLSIPVTILSGFAIMRFLVFRENKTAP